MEPEELNAAMKKHGVTTLRIAPQNYKHTMGRESMGELMDMAAQCHIPVFFDYSQAIGDELYDLCSTYPGVPFVVTATAYALNRWLGPVLDCCNVDYADVHDIVYRDIHVEYDDIIPPCLIQKNDAETYPVPTTSANPPLIMAVTFFHHEYSAGGTRRGINRDIVFENIHVYGDAPLIANFDGYTKEHQTKNVTIRNIFKNGKKVDPSEIIIRKNEFVENIVVE